MSDDNMIPRITIPDKRDRLIVSRALIALTHSLSHTPMTIHEYIDVMRTAIDLLDAVCEHDLSQRMHEAFGDPEKIHDDVEKWLEEFGESGE